MSEEPIFDMAAARRKFNASFDNSRSARKRREVSVASVIDRRSLRATGRTEQFNFRARVGLKDAVQAAAQQAGIPVAEWMERAAEGLLNAQDPA
jgi:hypothetical protein